MTEELPEVHVNHQMFFDHYHEYIAGKEDLKVKPEEILRLMKLVDAIRVSAREHRSVDFE